MFRLTKSVMVALLILFTTSAVSVGREQESDWHKVTGVVTNVDGSRIAGACVSAMPTDRSSAGTLECTHSDQNGVFTMRLRAGRYLIRARDEAEGYPDPNFLLSKDPATRFPEVLVSHSDVSGLSVVLGSKGGVIEGEIRERNNGMPISKAKVTISDAHDLKAFVEVFSNQSGHFAFTVPRKAIVISVSASGYKAVRLYDGTEFTLSGGERRDVTVELDPSE